MKEGLNWNIERHANFSKKIIDFMKNSEEQPHLLNCRPETAQKGY